MRLNKDLYPKQFSAKEVNAIVKNIKKKWDSLKGSTVSRGNYLHVSCTAGMKEEQNPDGTTSIVPFVTKGTTYRKPKENV